MTTPIATPHYARALIFLHWAMALLLVVVFASMELREIFPKGSAPREAMKVAHFMLGLSVLALVALRLAIRLGTTTPPIEPAPASWTNVLSHAAHFALYGLMIAMPILGWLILSAEGKDIPFFGLNLPPLMVPNHDAVETFEELHEALGTLFYIVIGMHTAAALAHHYLIKDNTLARILPHRQRSASV